jgi:hypothetical protein
VTLHDGKYGPYVKHGRINASLNEGSDPDALTLAQALELLAARAAAKGAGSGRGSGRGGGRGSGAARRRARPAAAGASAGGKTAPRARAGPRSQRAGAGKPGAKPAGAKRSGAATRSTAKKAPAGAAKPKAKPEDLIPFLDRLDPGDREVVASLDGLGRAAESAASLARRLGRSEAEVEAAAKRGRFKLRMAYGKARAGG